MLPVRSILVDFDGTACSHDVAEHVMERFGEPDWATYDEAWCEGSSTRAPRSARRSRRSRVCMTN